MFRLGCRTHGLGMHKELASIPIVNMSQIESVYVK